MTDVVSKEVRSRMMSGIKSKNTKPEIMIRRGLHKQGYRYRLHDHQLPGKPDLVFSRHKAIIFVNGCFWHGHDCLLFKWPSSREEFWKTKISRNQDLDSKNIIELQQLNWRIAIIWECALKGKLRLKLEVVIDKCATWIISDVPFMEVFGHM